MTTKVTTTVTMERISDLCGAYARAREALDAVAEAIRGEQRAAARKRRRSLQSRVAQVSAAREALHAALAAAPQLFDSPRSRSIEGVKVGYRKMPGKIEIADEGRAIARVRERLPDRAAELVRVKESLDRAALRRLDGRQLAAIGVSVVEADDEIVLAVAGSDLDKLVDALMADADATEKSA